MPAILTRLTSAPGTVGSLTVENEQFSTLELPWNNNAPFLSCIPCGRYEVVKWNSPSKHDCFKILNVPNREEILIHIGNYLKNTEGCVLIGTRYSERDNMLQASADALERLKQIAPDGFTLDIATACACTFQVQ